MALLGDRVQETTTSTGTGSITLNGAVTGYVTFNSTFSNGNSVWYVIDDGAGNWEIGYGTVGTGTLTRTVFQSSNANALVPFGVGTKRVFCTAPYTYLLPDQTGNSGKILTTDGTTSSWTTIASAGGVTSVSVASANGFAGTSSGGSTPALTLSTSISGILKGNGTAISAAVAGTDYAAANASFTLGSTSVSLGGTTTTVAGLTLTNPTINGFTGDTSVVNIGSGQFYKDTSGNVGIGTSSPGVKLDVNGGISLGASNNLTWGGVYGANIPTIAGSSTNGFTFYPTGSTGGERMRLDSSGNLGIGTSSPGQKLEVSGSAYITGGVGGQGCYLTRNGSDGGAVYSAQVGSIQIAAPSTNPITFVTNSTEKMRLDSSGNLGLGVTPSAWSNSYKSFDNKSASLYSLAGTTGGLAYNAYYNGTNWLYQGNGGNSPSSRYEQSYYTPHAWYVAASGTAGNAISFTQAMTLDASGNLGIGTSSPGYRLDVSGSVRLKTGATGTPVIVSTGGDSQGTLRFGSASTEYSINGGADYLAMIFNANGSERARIDSSGNFMVGTTSTSPVDASADGIKIGGTGYFLNLQGFQRAGAAIGRASTTGGIIDFYYRSSSTISVGTISTNGTNTAYNTSSDERLKTNVTPAGSAIQSILDFPVDQFDWISSGEHQDFGAVAQKAINFIPEIVTIPADPDEMWGIDWSKAVPRLIKTSQEQHELILAFSAELNELKKRIN